MNCLMPQQQRLRSHIDEVLDLQLIEQKIENEAFDIKYYAQFIQGLMAQFCAPVRDEEVEKIKHITDIVPLFKYVLKFEFTRPN